MSQSIDDPAELSPQARRILSGLTGQRFDCQSRGHVHTPLQAPWRGADREQEKTRLFKYVRSESAGVPLSKVVCDVFGQDSVEAAGADYQLARRFFERWSVFKIERRDGNLWVEPTLEAFNLSQTYANRKTTGGRQGGLSNGESRGETEGDDRADSPTDVGGGQVGTGDGPTKWAKDRARATLSKRGPILDGSNGRADYRAELLRELATERQSIDGKVKILERIRGAGPEYLLFPYRTRFNSPDRAGDVQEGFSGALARAAEDYSDAVVLTVTTDAKRFSSQSEAIEGLQENKNRLLSWLGTDYQLGHRPENLTVLEFTESGLPHYHIVLFGVSWLTHQKALAGKWDDLGQGSVVDVRTATERGGRWLLHNDDGGTVTLRQYAGKAIDDLIQVAGMDTGELRDAVDAGDVSLWRQALYWATGKQYYSCSPSLKEPTDGEELPHIKRYEFRGAARYDALPGYVRRNGLFMDRGRPPPTTGTASGTRSKPAAD